MKATLPPPVRKYLESLELELKKQVGVSPEEALSDAREFLQNNWESLSRAEPGLEDGDIYAHFVETFGSPESVAESYADTSDPFRQFVPGYAPGWRVCCTKCGRSAPAGKVGITRIGACSSHKYTLGFCRTCRWIRFVRIVRDSDRTNLTQQLGTDRTPDAVRRTMHRPWLVILGTIAFVITLSLLIHLVTAQAVAGQDLPTVFETLPDGWSLQKSSVVPAVQRDAIGRKLDARLSRLTNTTVAKQGQSLQINTLECTTDAEASRVQATLLKAKSNRRLVQRNDRTVYEFVVRNQNQMSLALAARYEFGIQPPLVNYQVRFDAVPVVSGDDMQWNTLFNLFLQAEHDDSSEELQRRIRERAEAFRFGNRLTLRHYGLGNHVSRWSLVPIAVRDSAASSADYDVFNLENLPQRAGVPFVGITGEITCETGKLTPAKRSSNELTASTSYWPVNDPVIQKLAGEITGACRTSRDKVAALLQWMTPGANIRFDGPIQGSRYGVRKVLEQGFGHCWDFSDVFVTLCRASGVPSGQVMGWLDGGEGHVWAEVLFDGEGWQQVDPTAASACGSDYIPFVSSDDGTVPLLYVSSVHIEKRE